MAVVELIGPHRRSRTVRGRSNSNLAQEPRQDLPYTSRAESIRVAQSSQSDGKSSWTLYCVSPEPSPEPMMDDKSADYYDAEYDYDEDRFGSKQVSYHYGPVSDDGPMDSSEVERQALIDRQAREAASPYETPEQVRRRLKRMSNPYDAYMASYYHMNPGHKLPKDRSRDNGSQGVMPGNSEPKEEQQLPPQPEPQQLQQVQQPPPLQQQQPQQPQQHQPTRRSFFSRSPKQRPDDLLRRIKQHDQQQQQQLQQPVQQQGMQASPMMSPKMSPNLTPKQATQVTPVPAADSKPPAPAPVPRVRDAEAAALAAAAGGKGVPATKREAIPMPMDGEFDNSAPPPAGQDPDTMNVHPPRSFWSYLRDWYDDHRRPRWGPGQDPFGPDPVMADSMSTMSRHPSMYSSSRSRRRWGRGYNRYGAPRSMGHGAHGGYPSNGAYASKSWGPSSWGPSGWNWGAWNWQQYNYLGPMGFIKLPAYILYSLSFWLPWLYVLRLPLDYFRHSRYMFMVDFVAWLELFAVLITGYVFVGVMEVVLSIVKAICSPAIFIVELIFGRTGTKNG